MCFQTGGELLFQYEDFSERVVEYNKSFLPKIDAVKSITQTNLLAILASQKS